MRGEGRSQIPFGSDRGTHYGPRGLRSNDVCLVVGGKSRDTLELPNQLMILAKKPQDISEPTTQDTSKHLDILAIMTMTSWLRGRPLEGWNVMYYGKESFKRSHATSASDESRFAGIKGGPFEVKVKIMSESPQSQAIRPFDTSKGQVCALVTGQALDCGIGPAQALPDSITYLSAKDVLRWNKASEWLKKWERQHPAVNIQEFQLGHQILWILLSEIRKYDLGLSRYWGLLVGHISDFPREPAWLDMDVGRYTLDLMINERKFLLLLVTLPLVYGGIHLATWDFNFASKTEHLLWKIACFDIMGTIPFGLLYFLGRYPCLLFSNERLIVLYHPLFWAIYSPLAALYALARLYIVVESFISLRHVPIGSYAAVPWVQDIPHV